MSIIHEALKKTQESMKQAALEAARAKESSENPAQAAQVHSDPISAQENSTSSHAAGSGIQHCPMSSRAPSGEIHQSSVSSQSDAHQNSAPHQKTEISYDVAHQAETPRTSATYSHSSSHTETHQTSAIYAHSSKQAEARAPAMQDYRSPESEVSSPRAEAQRASAPHVPQTPAHHAQPIKEARQKTRASIEALVQSPNVWRALGTTSLLGLFLVGMVATPSIFHVHMNIKTLPFFSHLNAKPLAENKEKPIVAAPTNLVLNGIMMEGQHRVAVINDQTYEVGDRIDDKKITAISIDRVTLQNNQNSFELKTRV